MSNPFLSKRMQKLIGKAAEVLENGSDPFDNWFLRENDVTANECMGMSTIMAVVLKWFLTQSAAEAVKVILYDQDPQIAQVASQLYSQKELIRKLEELNASRNLHSRSV